MKNGDMIRDRKREKKRIDDVGGRNSPVILVRFIKHPAGDRQTNYSLEHGSTTQEHTGISFLYDHPSRVRSKTKPSYGRAHESCRRAQEGST